MSTIHSSARRSASHGEALRPTIVTRRLSRYHTRYRATVAALAVQHDRLADLAASFPALLFALAVPRFGHDPVPAIGAVVAGQRLSQVAALARQPMWLRKLSPEALQAPLPTLPDGDVFRRQILNHLPRSPNRMSLWLDAVSAAAVCGSEPIAVWVAREVTALRTTPTALDLPGLRLVVLWAWFSTQPGTLGRELIVTPWVPSMKFSSAQAAAKAWRDLVTLHLCLGEKPIVEVWFEPAVIDGYEIVPLTTSQAIVAEAARMENCLATYGGRISSNQSRIWSVRRSGQPVATIEVGRTPYRRHDTFVGVLQMRGFRNAAVTDEVRDIVARWQMRQDLRNEPMGSFGTERELHQAWIAMWRPYWRAKRRIPEWLPLKRRLNSLW